MRTLDEVQADIMAIEQTKIRPLSEFIMDQHNDQGIGLPALLRLRNAEEQLVALRLERAEILAAS